MQEAYRVRSHVAEDGTLTVENLPFSAGQEVEVIVLADVRRAREQKRYPLRGLAVQYTDPTAPVALDEWDALR